MDPDNQTLPLFRGEVELLEWNTMNALSGAGPAFFLFLTLASSGSSAQWSPGADFHSGGTGDCAGCHLPMTTDQPSAQNGYLLLGTDSSSTCLRCHATRGGYTQQHHVMAYPAPYPGAAPQTLTPGGDFAYLLRTYTAAGSPDSPSYFSPGERHGHNVVAAEFGISADSRHATPPGGGFPTASLQCTSCHDAHGSYRVDASGRVLVNSGIGSSALPNVGSGSYGAIPLEGQTVGTYRMLAGAGYRPPSGNGLTFQSDPPVAVSPDIYNRSEHVSETRVAYGRGMSEWCMNCHTSLLVRVGSGSANHVSGSAARLGAEVLSNYNSYVQTGRLDGSQANSYNSLVPFEEGTGDLRLLASHATRTATSSPGPLTGNENVSCITCHRAHASGFDSMLRWNSQGAFLTLAGQYPGTDAETPEARSPELSTGKTVLEYQAAMYGRPASRFAPHQRSLCNKCHATD